MLRTLIHRIHYTSEENILTNLNITPMLFTEESAEVNKKHLFRGSHHFQVG